MRISKQSSIECSVNWRSNRVQHSDRYFLAKANFLRDLFPGSLGVKLEHAKHGEHFSENATAGEIIPGYLEKNVLDLRESQISPLLNALSGGKLSVGRYYPRGLLKGVPNIFAQDKRPFRFLGKKGSSYRVDLNHPLASYPLSITARLVENLNSIEERGGSCNDIVQLITESGPGLQAIDAHIKTSYLEGRPFTRQTEGDDADFYRFPRMVNHIDDTAIVQVKKIYGTILENGTRVLDLMSSCTSHLPEDLYDLMVIGLGLNAEELYSNKKLSDFFVHDLNRNPTLPFDNQYFNAAICTVSVEYLIKPIEVFNEVARVLKPGSPFILTFSERWFPPKVIKRWTELHPFERMGMVLEYFRISGRFNDLHTDSIRGLLRPVDDKYASVLPFSDPVYTVWGRVA